MRQLKLSVLALLLGAPALAHGQPAAAYVDRYDDSVSGEAVPSIEVFYDQLSPYGVWVDEPVFGRVFIPDELGFRPYTNGHWEYTNVGSVWISSEPFGWATSHYGRWLYSSAYERWVWRPDTTWGPAWVEWRQYGDYFGWAPLVPDDVIEIGYAPPLAEWHYCQAAHIYDPRVSRYYEAESRVREIHRAARPIGGYATIGGARVVVGPSPAVLHERHVNVQPTALAMHAVGRWTPTETRAAVQRAQQRRPIVEETNRKRIENNAPVHQVQTRVQQQQQARPSPKAQPQERPQAQQPRQPQQVEKQPQRPQVQQQPQRPQQPQEPQRPQVQKQPQPPQARPQPQPPQVQRQPPQPQRPQVPKQPQPPQVQKQPQPPQPQVQPHPQQPRPPQAPQRPQAQPQQPPPRQPNAEHKREPKHGGQ